MRSRPGLTLHLRSLNPTQRPYYQPANKGMLLITIQAILPQRLFSYPSSYHVCDAVNNYSAGNFAGFLIKAVCSVQEFLMHFNKYLSRRNSTRNLRPIDSHIDLSLFGSPFRLDLSLLTVLTKNSPLQIR
jgi:hypothetical protein